MVPELVEGNTTRITVSLGVVTFPGRINAFKNFLNSIFVGSQLPNELIIVINGIGNSNGSKITKYIELLKNITDQFNRPPVKLICVTENVPIGYCRALIVKYSTCDYIAIMDDDVIIDPLCMEKIIYSLRFSPDILAGRVELPPNLPSKIIKYLRERPWYNQFIFTANYKFMKIKYAISKDIFLINGISGVWTNHMVIKRELISRIGNFNPILGYFGDDIGGEDTEFKIRARKSGARFLYNKNAIVYHRINPKRLTPSYALKRSWHHGLAYSYIFPLRYLVKACVYEFLSIFYYFLKDRRKELFLAVTRFISVMSGILSMRKRKYFLDKRISGIRKAKYSLITL